MFFSMLPEQLGEAGHKSPPEVPGPDREQCLECAFGKLLTSSGVATADQNQARDTIAEAAYISTTMLNTRATIYRCGATGCEHAVMIVTAVDQPLLPANTADMQMYGVPGSTNCVLPKEDIKS